MRAGAAPRYPWSVALARTGRRTARLAKAVARVTKRRPGRRIRLDNDARRAQLLELGQKAFAERTYDEVSIDDIARAAGISKGLLYHYFPTKRDLYVTLTADARQVAAHGPSTATAQPTVTPWPVPPPVGATTFFSGRRP